MEAETGRKDQGSALVQMASICLPRGSTKLPLYLVEENAQNWNSPVRHEDGFQRVNRAPGPLATGCVARGHRFSRCIGLDLSFEESCSEARSEGVRSYRWQCRRQT